MDIATAIPLFRFGLRQRQGSGRRSKRNHRFVLPAVAFVMGFGEPNADAGKAHFAE